MSDDGFGLVGAKPALLPPDSYESEFAGWQTKYYFKTPKVYLSFVVKYKGETKVFRRHYNVKALVGDVGHNGLFTFTANQSFCRDYFRLHGKPEQFTKDFMDVFYDKKYMCTLKTVTADSNGEPLDKASYYSTINRVRVSKEEAYA